MRSRSARLASNLQPDIRADVAVIVDIAVAWLPRNTDLEEWSAAALAGDDMRPIV